MIVVLLVLLLLFGASRLPKLARSMGQAGKEFKEGVKEGSTTSTTSIEGDCPFCGADVPSGSSFCPGCAKNGGEVVAARSDRSLKSA